MCEILQVFFLNNFNCQPNDPQVPQIHKLTCIIAPRFSFMFSLLSALIIPGRSNTENFLGVSLQIK